MVHHPMMDCQVSNKKCVIEIMRYATKGNIDGRVDLGSIGRCGDLLPDERVCVVGVDAIESHFEKV